MNKKETITLLTNPISNDLVSHVVYGTETREIEVKPYGKVWTKEYLDSLVEQYKKDKDKFIQNDELIFNIAYIFNDKKENKLVTSKLSDIREVFTVARLLKIKQSKKDDKNNSPIYTLTFKGITRAKLVNKPDSFVNTKGNIIKSINDLAYFRNTTNFPYDSLYNLAEFGEKLQYIDEAISALTVTSVWSKIISARLQRLNPNLNYEKLMQNTSFAGNEEGDLQNSYSVIISSLMVYIIVDNWIKYLILSKEDGLDQLIMIYNEIYDFQQLRNWSPKEKQIFESQKLFQEPISLEANNSKTSKTLNKNNKKSPKNNNKNDLPNKSDDVIADAMLEEELNKKIKTNLDKQQKEFLLREKMKAIKESLSETAPDGEDDEDEEFVKILRDPKKSKMFPDSVLKIINGEKERLKSMMSGTPDANTTASYINVLKSMPWRKVEIETLDIKKAREVLDKNHYGLKEVKERIIEYLSLIINHKNIAKKNGNQELIDIDENHQIDMALFKEKEPNQKVQRTFNNVPILTLVGPPGTGKTSLARAIAEALNKSYVKISLGGVHDESEIRGHRRTYVGSMPGKIIKAIQRSGVSNPLILLDEIDKMSSDYKGDPSSAMLEVLDPEQNTKFQDNYLEHEYDLSKVMFIATANYYENIPAPLIDRVEILELHSYTINEKIKIAREHLLDIAIKQAGINENQFIFTDDVIEFIIKRYTAEAGVRGLKRAFDKIARKIVTKIVSGENIEKFEVTKDVVLSFLGTPKFSEPIEDKEPQVGVVNGLAYTSIGGTTLQIEVSTYPGKGLLKLTGSLKDVMKESASIALTYVRSNAEKFGIKDFDFDKNEIHIHVPEGAVPKDGPSAGVTFTTALVSALANKPVPQDVAMTGEITLRGRVLEIGGLKEKSFAAYKKNVKKVFIPKNNEKNLVDIPDEVKESIKFVPVESYDEIYKELFSNTKN
ncbi:endopeptidase La [Mycoplasma sp. Mirounga ES2805-ORL]|uniref:endopeptidase La n=1 Tax=Mycoplasma sp. Mirounga ES2805-ORL TaxID=754514 RepID=UPI00197C3DC8|nr:endopeptidase La [Mycoplasma sp. Mirounga ES2805-ORL]QSF13799.1 endopeptidase La [Mycoplasma sp. Mirounga ES2805-ORL]